MIAGKIIKEDIMQEQILQAAKKLFQVHGFYKVTMDDVAKAIGKGRSSLYYYYKSKDEIFDAVMGIEIKEMLDAMAAAIEKVTTTEQKIYAFFSTKLKVLSQKMSFFNTLNVGMDADAISDFNKTKIVHHNYIMKSEGAMLSRILAYGMEQGELRILDKKEQKALIFVLLSSIRGIKREMSMEDNFKGIEGVVKTWSTMVIQGIRK